MVLTCTLLKIIVFCLCFVIIHEWNKIIDVSLTKLTPTSSNLRFTDQTPKSQFYNIQQFMIKINIKAYFYWKVEVYSVILVLFDLLQLRGGVKVLYCFSLV